MAIYKSESGLTALKLVDEITSIFGQCYRLDAGLWHHVGNTEPCDPSLDEKELEQMFQAMVENLDKQEFDLSKSMGEISDIDLMQP